MKKPSTLLLFLLLSSLGFAQQNTPKDTSAINFLERTFAPSLQVGYLWHNAPSLGGSIMFQTSLEYRTKSGLFFRVNFDEFTSSYEFDSLPNFSNVFEGKVSFTELLGGIGYRNGNATHRGFVLVQPGVRWYSYPMIEAAGSDLAVALDSRNTLSIRYSAGYEYYVDSKNCFSLELLLCHIPQQIDYWTNGNLAYGFTLGFSTAFK